MSDKYRVVSVIRYTVFWRHGQMSCGTNPSRVFLVGNTDALRECETNFNLYREC